MKITVTGKILNIGKNLVISGNSRIVIGYKNKVVGRDNYVLGIGCNIEGSKNKILGINNSIEGIENYVVGFFNNIKGRLNRLIGMNNLSSGEETQKEIFCIKIENKILSYVIAGFFLICLFPFIIKLLSFGVFVLAVAYVFVVFKKGKKDLSEDSKCNQPTAPDYDSVPNIYPKVPKFKQS